MAGEVENFLLQKLDQAMKDTNKKEHKLSAKLFDLHSDFTDLKDLLSDPARATTPEEKSKRRENLYYLNNILTEWQLISGEKKFYNYGALIIARNLSQNLNKIKKELKGGEASGTAEKSASGTAQAPATADVSLEKNHETYRWSSRTVDRSKVRGLDDKERFLERMLVRKESKDGFKAIAIVGMVGVGKTTLCQVMFNNQRIKENFLPRIWVCMSKQREDDSNHAKEIVKRMLVCLGVEDEIIQSAGQDPDLELQRLIFALRLQLMGKKYLIVLDDAWNPEEKRFENLTSQPTQSESCYEQLAYGLPKGQGGTVIVTTRSNEIAKNMVGKENLQRLLPIKDREICLRIFDDSVEKDGKKFPEKLKELRNLIIDKCAGLPGAAKMMGEIMHQKLSIPNNPVPNQGQQNQNHQQSQPTL